MGMILFSLHRGSPHRILYFTLFDVFLISSGVSGWRYTRCHVQGKLHHRTDSILFWQWRKVVLRGIRLWKLFKVGSCLLNVHTFAYVPLFVTCNCWPVNVLLCYVLLNIPLLHCRSGMFPKKRIVSWLYWFCSLNLKQLLSDELWSDTDCLDLSVAEIVGKEILFLLFASCLIFWFNTQSTTHTVYPDFV